MKVLTTILDTIAVVFVLAGAFAIHPGLGAVTCGLVVGGGSIVLDKASRAE